MLHASPVAAYRFVRVLFFLAFIALLPQQLVAIEYYWVGGSGMWSDHNAHWATASGGNVFHDQVPQSMDNVHFDANSFSSGGTVTIDQTIIYCRDMDWTGAGGTPVLSGPSDKQVWIYGSLTLTPNMQWNVAGQTHFLAFQLGKTIIMAGHAITSDVYFEGVGGEWTFLDKFRCLAVMRFLSGTLNTNSEEVEAGAFVSEGNGVRVLDLGDSDFHLINGAFIAGYTSVNLTVIPGTSHIILESPNGQFYGGQQTWYDVTFTTHPIGSNHFFSGNVLNKLTCGNFVQINQGRPGNSIHEAELLANANIFGNNTFDILTLTQGKTYVLLANSTQTITPLGNFIALGTGGFPIEIKSSQIGQQATLHKDGDPICLDFLYLTDIAATGTGFTYAGANSDDVFNNSGWIFSACPSCFSDPALPAPTLDPASVTTLQCGGLATLILANLPAGFEAVWFNESQTIELYSSVTNLFQPNISQNTIFYGAIRELTTGCVSELLEVQVLLIDNPPTALCKNITINLSPGDCNTSIVASDVNNGSNDDCGTVTLSVDPNLCPIGTTIVTLTVTDNTGQTSSCTATVSVLEFPNPIQQLNCNDFVKIQLGQNCAACIGADDVLEGEPYGCYDDYIVELDKTLPYGNGPWVPACVGVTDIGKTYQYRVTDPVTGNKCWGDVKIVDGILPLCQAPNGISIQCANFDPKLVNYGLPIISECCLDPTKVYQGQIGLTHTVNYTQFDTLCSKGTLVRIFKAFDCYGNSSQCSQTIVVTYQQDYYVRFPNDVIATVCDGTGNYGSPTFFGEDCELFGITYEDEIFTVVPDACYKIERNWKILNWCTYNPNQGCTNVPNPMPNAIKNHPSNLPGPIVSPIQTVGDPWKSTIVKINATDPMATNYSIYYDPNVNCYTYKQIIKVIDSDEPVLDCPGVLVTVCDTIPNTSFLWNASYWWDNNNQSHDLDEAPSEICLIATDLCTGSNIDIEFQLFLDLDGDGILETVVNSTELGNQPGGLGWNNILFGNLFGPGESRQFDFRPVPIDQKWGFAFEEVVVGNNKTVCVKFNTFQNPGTFVEPQLPRGTHKIKWLVTDECGNRSECEYNFTIEDCPCDNCEPTILITDPCICKNNATTLTNGQFGEMIKIESGPGKTWTLVNNIGLYDINSPPPPALPFLIPVGTPFVEIPLQSGDYYLSGVHVDGEGYTITVESETGETLSIGNLCNYPKPVITADLSGIYCLYSDPVVLTGNPGDDHLSNQGFIQEFTVNGVGSGQFIPSLGVGTYEIVYTVNGGVSKAYGIADPGCIISSDTVFVVVNPPPSITCPDNVSVNAAPGLCSMVVDNLTPVTNIDECPTTLSYSLSGATNGSGDGDASGQTFNVGQTLVNYYLTGNGQNFDTCSFIVTVFDIEPPVTICVSGLVLDNDPGACARLITNNLYDASTTDNCPGPITKIHDYAPAPNNSTLAGALFPVGITVIHWTSTDQAGNQSSCFQELTVRDVESPVFVNCPTQMIMVANDPDKCSAKINWPPPVATDNCGNPMVIQTGGPVSGSVIAVTCPSGPTTITYIATDTSGNTASCIFDIMVVDTQKPAFDADITMPGDMTVNCDQVPDSCVFHGPLNCSPLSNNDVHDNCTAPADLLIAFAETSTQDPNPANCGHYNYLLTRTWTVTDCGDNQLTHTQLITVQDVTKPIAVCKNITLTLNDFGSANFTPKDIDGGSTDNCAASANLSFITSLTVFDCLKLGVNTVTLTVTDPCGNFSTCTATVTVVEGKGKCVAEYDATGSDPCVCLDNATNLVNGQFSELIQIHALANQTWSVVNSSGLYLASSPAPPAAPVSMPNGTMFQNGQTDGIDNDGDGLTDELDERVYYTLKGRHVDALGYSALFRSNLNQDIALESKCYYPTPYFKGALLLDDPFCLNSPVFSIEVGEENNAVGGIVPGSVMVDGVVTTTFNAGQLGLGVHTIMATFDAGTAQPFTKLNGVVVAGSDLAAMQDPGCRQKITKTVHVIETPATLVCNDLIYVSMDASCKAVVNPDDVLEGTYFCFSDYLVEIDKTLPLGNGPWLPATFDASDIGKTYFYRVVHIGGSSNVCWGQIKIEDKLVPKLVCPANITVACSESTNVAHTGNVNIADCSSTNTVVDNQFTDFGECSNPRAQIVRRWIVTDTWGNQSICSHTITITPFVLASLVWPDDAIVNCEAGYLNSNATSPDNTGRPSLNNFPLGVGGYCTTSVGFTDERLETCPGAYVILRTWNVFNVCQPVGPSNPVQHTQVVRVKDFAGPAFACPPAVMVSTDPFNCCSTTALPSMIVTEGCSNIVDLEAKVTGTNPANGNVITFTVPGHLGDFAGNNYWVPDTLAIFDYTQCLPLGTYQVQYSAADGCGNSSKCLFDLTVADFVPPVAACDQTTVVGINGDDPYDCYTPANGCDGAGVTWVKALTYDDGSYDNCNQLKFTIRRMAPYSDCINSLSKNPCYPGGKSEFDLATAESDSIKFYCCEVGSVQTVILRVYQVDVNGNFVPGIDGEPLYNECMVQVTVQDKIKPVCQSPANVTVTCEQFDPSLWVYGKADVLDNCCLDTTKVYQGQCGLTHSVSYNQFDTLCNKGTIVRTFRAFDCHGNSSQCTQRIVVTYEQDYFVRFPNDVIVTICDGTGVYGEPTFFGEDCELLGVSYEDAIFTVVPDACYKIERSWKIINWCTFNPNGICIDVPNPNPNATSNHPSNLPGPIVSPIQTTGDPWKSTIVKINSTDALATNYSIYYNSNANCYTYKQIIKVIDTQAPVIDCPATPVTVCDVTPNDAQLWNESYWWDNGNQSHDLCEAPSDICITATDLCSGSNINIEYQLFLDLDGDGTMETVVNSTQLGNQSGGLGWNNIMFGNFTGAGVSRQFDGRPVATNQKWGFAIQETVTGTNKTACVKFNTFQAQNTFVTPQLPHGTHKIKWIVSDGCGNEKVCEYTIIVKDCKAPTVVCLNGLSVNIMPTGMIQLWATDFLQYGEDNCTQTPYLKYGIRKCGTGTGFPLDALGNPITNVTFDCSELGTQCVELWSIDLAGNADFCETYVIVQDNNGNCAPSNHVVVSGALKTEATDGVEEGNVNITGSVNFAPPFSFFDLSSNAGIFNVSNSVPIAADFTVSPLKDDNPLNGVTTYDLVLISKHILGIEPLGSPYKMIAADANKSNSITTFDIVELRKLILGIHQELPSNTSWRFVDKGFAFPNAANPFQTAFPENISVAQAMTHQLGEDFVGVKIGDVNNTVVANTLMTADDRTVGTLLFDLSDRSVRAGEEFEVAFTADQRVQGFQMTLNLNGLEVSSIVENDKVTTDNFGIFADALTVSIDDADAFTVKFRATKAGKLSEMMGVSSRITKSESYSLTDGRMDVALRFDGKTIAGIGFELYQNQPNPFVNKTFVGFHLPAAATATLTVYDETGRVVFTQRGDFAKGYNAISLDRALLNTTGLLYYSLETATDAATKKMIQAK